jgi:hypothetical protein
MDCFEILPFEKGPEFEELLGALGAKKGGAKVQNPTNDTLSFRERERSFRGEVLDHLDR